MSDTFFKNCQGNTCYGRVAPIRVGDESKDDITKVGLSMFCPITEPSQLSESTLTACKIDQSAIDIEGHINLDDEGFIYSCRSTQSSNRSDSTYRKEDSYKCTKLVQRQGTDAVVNTLNTEATQNVQTLVDEIANVQKKLPVGTVDPFASEIPEIVQNATNISNNREYIEANSKKINEFIAKHKTAPLPRFGFARME